MLKLSSGKARVRATCAKNAVAPRGSDLGATVGQRMWCGWGRRRSARTLPGWTVVPARHVGNSAAVVRSDRWGYRCVGSPLGPEVLRAFLSRRVARSRSRVELSPAVGLDRGTKTSAIFPHVSRERNSAVPAKVTRPDDFHKLFPDRTESATRCQKGMTLGGTSFGAGGTAGRSHHSDANTKASPKR